jgi:hypothetical protein
MGWAEDRIEAYRHGRPASWLERRMLEHANPVHFPLALMATIGFIYGLWMHDWFWILGASVVALLGHVYCWTRQQGQSQREPKLPQRQCIGCASELSGFTTSGEGNNHVQSNVPH